MTQDLAATRGQPKRKGGRPSREQASTKALLGLDLTACDPLAILREIALDRSQPGSTRVSACRTLLGLSEGSEAQPSTDALTSRALQILQRRPN